MAGDTTSSFILMEDDHSWHNDGLWYVNDNEMNCQLDIEVKGIYLKSALWFVTPIPLTFSMEGVHIWYHDCLWCVDIYLRRSNGHAIKIKLKYAQSGIKLWPNDQSIQELSDCCWSRTLLHCEVNWTRLYENGTFHMCTKLLFNCASADTFASIKLSIQSQRNVLMSRDMWLPTMWHFDKCRLKPACAASF